MTTDPLQHDDRELGDVATRLLFSNELVNVWEMQLEPGERSDHHRHDHPYLLCVLEGEAVDATANGRPGRIHIPVQPGSVFFVPPGATETAVNRSGTRFREILVELKVPAPDGLTVQTANVPAPAERVEA